QLYPLDDQHLGDSSIARPEELQIEAWIEEHWESVNFEASLPGIQGLRANTLRFETIATTKLRVTLVHAEKKY
ncbi:MAG: hypothetical protein ACPHL6_12735, partial [Rubripirellula sp.]